MLNLFIYANTVIYYSASSNRFAVNVYNKLCYQSVFSKFSCSNKHIIYFNVTQLKGCLVFSLTAFPLLSIT